ncbi:MAG: hypothetical protein JO341_14820 [Gammaproteobacteria bacterium]|nr:hypothetical protein [Gammaproteobacteria bacterium]MBV9622279.1 hypothetical protein [Gammaproteobacteria bacterium]
MSYEPNSPGAENFGDSTGLGDQTSKAASELKGKAQGLGRRAAERANDARRAAAGGMDTVANTLHEKADSLPGGERVSSAAHSAADALASGAQYVRDNDLQDMMQDLLEVVRNNPGPALLGAVALGFLVGRAVSRD